MKDAAVRAAVRLLMSMPDDPVKRLCLLLLAGRNTENCESALQAARRWLKADFGRSCNEVCEQIGMPPVTPSFMEKKG